MSILNRLNKKTKELAKGSQQKLLDEQLEVEKMTNLFNQVEKLKNSKILVFGKYGGSRNQPVIELKTVLGNRSWHNGQARKCIFLDGPIYSFFSVTHNPFNASTNTYYFDTQKLQYVIDEDSNGTHSYQYYQNDTLLLDHLLTQIAKRKVNQTSDGKIWSSQIGLKCDSGDLCGVDNQSLLRRQPEKFYYCLDPKRIGPGYEKVWVCEFCFQKEQNAIVELEKLN